MSDPSATTSADASGVRAKVRGRPRSTRARDGGGIGRARARRARDLMRARARSTLGVGLTARCRRVARALDRRDGETDGGARGRLWTQFIEDVEAYVAGREVDDALGELQRRYSTYKRLEAELQQTRIRLSQQLPDVRRSLEAVEVLCEKRDRGEEEATTVKYQLTEATFADAEVETPESVYLWLGANVMLEYPLDEAKELLEANVKACESGLEANSRDLAVIKDNVTITEVNMARLYNHDVKKKKERAREQQN